MTNKRPTLVETIFPFIFIGIVIALSVLLFAALFYLLAIGVFIGGALGVVYWIKNKFFKKPDNTAVVVTQTKERIIEHDPNEKL